MYGIGGSDARLLRPAVGFVVVVVVVGFVVVVVVNAVNVWTLPVPAAAVPDCAGFGIVVV